MNCKQLEKHIPDFLSGDIDNQTLQEFNDHVSTCSTCEQDVESLEHIWLKLRDIPDSLPSPQLRHRFFAMVDAYKAGQVDTNPGSTNILKMHAQGKVYNLLKAVAIVVFMVIGTFGSYQLYKSNDLKNDELVQMRDEVRGLNRLVLLTMMNETSASQRLKGIRYASKLEKADDEVIDTLFDTIENDTNMNVKLASIEAFQNFAEDEDVRSHLLTLLIKESSPAIQIALIDLLVAVKAEQAGQVFKDMMDSERVNGVVKDHLDLGIKLLQ